ncbi:MAG TPA: glycosyltransferase family protein [Puia sp.]|nr:glycosyltransferase family protein [Puia sp.]
MKIFYAIQATGNGHISRAMEILPFLQRYGQVDLFLSGSNSSLPLDGPVKYRSRGFGLFYNASGSLSYRKMANNFSPLRIFKEARDLPVEKYDLVLNDFEFITSLACAYKKVPSVNFGHQASFQSEKTPRPEKKDFVGEWVLRNYARATQYVGLHFESYDDFILPPVIKKEIIRAEPIDKGHITVYLPSFSDRELAKYLTPLKDFCFHVFSKEVTQPSKQENILFFPVNKDAFNKSMIQCHAMVAGAGFETPAEALYLGKKLLVIPIGGQYEQFCNAAALEKMGIPWIQSLDDHFAPSFSDLMNMNQNVTLSPDHSTEAIISFLMHSCSAQKKDELDYIYPELVFN